MKSWTANLIQVVVLSVSFVATPAFADVGSRKEPLRVDFNQMIEKGNQDNQALQRGVLEAAQPTTENAAPAVNVPDVAVVAPPSPAQTETAASTRRAVIDFIDMEVGVGNEAAVVDRR